MARRGLSARRNRARTSAAPMKIWNTKYALTHGITVHEAKVFKNIPDMVEVSSSYYLHGEGKNWHRTRGAAVVRAYRMRDMKIAALKKSIAKLQALKFEDAP